MGSDLENMKTILSDPIADPCAQKMDIQPYTHLA